MKQSAIRSPVRKADGLPDTCYRQKTAFISRTALSILANFVTKKSIFPPLYPFSDVLAM